MTTNLAINFGKRVRSPTHLRQSITFHSIRANFSAQYWYEQLSTTKAFLSKVHWDGPSTSPRSRRLWTDKFINVLSPGFTGIGKTWMSLYFSRKKGDEISDTHPGLIQCQSSSQESCHCPPSTTSSLCLLLWTYPTFPCFSFSYLLSQQKTGNNQTNELLVVTSQA